MATYGAQRASLIRTIARGRIGCRSYRGGVTGRYCRPICAGCGLPFEPRRGQLACRPTCRLRAFRRRRRQTAIGACQIFE